MNMCEFSAPDIDGHTHSIAELHKSGFMLCQACRRFMDDLEAMTSNARRLNKVTDHA